MLSVQGSNSCQRLLAQPASLPAGWEGRACHPFSFLPAGLLTLMQWEPAQGISSVGDTPAPWSEQLSTLIGTNGTAYVVGAVADNADSRGPMLTGPTGCGEHRGNQ
ncbi:unnamed protein product [Pleuronectes platessa]|uniref:Uncharacterized protein n=1 Tax=Pleuronectes platessa TaxID=8262 RepID=A0A9N7YTY4_PLEPL|nr:unnamed protein product [Pleuronectes platessa]